MKKWLFSAGLVLLIMAMGCAPKAPVAPPVTPAPPPVATPAAQAITPEEAAWAKVVDAAKKEGKVTLYSFSFTSDVGRAVARAFEARHGIKVEIVTGIGTVLIERLKSEQAARKYIADTLDTSVTLVMMGKQDGLTQAMGELPVLREREVWVTVPRADVEGHIVGTRSAVFTPYINTALLKPDEAPKSFKDFLEPKWKKKIVIGNPVTVPSVVWIYLAYKKAGAMDDDYWRQLARQDLIFAPTTRDVPGMVARGDAPVSFPTGDTSAAPFIKQGATIRAIELEEGALVVPQSTAIAMAKNAPHPNATRVFINWLLSQEGHAVFSEAVGGFAPLRKDVADIRPAALRTEQKRIVVVDLAIQEETTRVQREGTMNRLLGMEK